MKKLIVIAGGLVAIIVIALVGFRMHTKSFSPNDVAQFEDGRLNIEVSYCRPFKKDREIFGSLVPYGKVWRTGANEATTFTTDHDILIKKKILNAGTYSLFSIPGEETWKIIFNKEIPSWGVNWSGEAARNPETDAIIVEVPSIATPDIFEQFTISFEEMGEEIEMILMWDQTLVVVPIYKIN